jgi:hypothetical protein
MLREVMASPAGQVVDPNKDQEDGDPYVLALALQLRRAGEDVCVVTDDHREHADHTSMVSAWDHLSLAWCRLAGFLDQVQARDVAAQVSGPRTDPLPRSAQDPLF